MTKWLRNTELLVKLGLLAFFSLLMWTGRGYPETSRFFPELLGGITIILIIASIILNAAKPKEKEKKEVIEPERPSSDLREEKLRRLKEIEAKSEGDAGYELLEASLRRKKVVQTILIMLISLIIGYLGGMLLIVPFLFVAFGLLHGQRKQTLKYIIIAAGITLMAYLFFTSLMGVPLLRETWWD